MIDLLFFIAIPLLGFLGYKLGFDNALALCFGYNPRVTVKVRGNTATVSEPYLKKNKTHFILTAFISLILCAALHKIPPFSLFDSSLLGIIIYIGIMYGIVTLIVNFVVSRLIMFFSKENHIIQIFNKLLGILFTLTIVLWLAWILLAFIYLVGGFFGGSEILQNIYSFLEAKGGRIFVNLLKINPIFIL